MSDTERHIGMIDYLVIGHVTRDVLPGGGYRLGGTVAYAGLTAHRLGLRVGVVTACAEDLDLSPLAPLLVHRVPSETTTTFENRETARGRVQVIREVATGLQGYHVPPEWRRAAIVHLAPVAQEVDPRMVTLFTRGLIGVTPQGWMREWDETGRVRTGSWPEAPYVLPRVAAAVLSIEDLGHDESRIADLAGLVPVLVVTRGAQGADLYWQGREYHADPPPVREVDPTGAGDIFAACFFVRLLETRDPVHALAFATFLASKSVEREGLAGVPTEEEIREAFLERIL